MTMEEQTILGVYIEENFDVEGMINLDFFQTKHPDQPFYIKDVRDYEAIAARICTFFGLKRITDYSKMPPYGDGLMTNEEKQVFDIITPKDWLLEDKRLVSLIENN